VKIVEEIVIKVENVGLQYNLSKEKVDNLKEWVIKFLKRDLTYNKFWAVKDVSFQVKKGEKLGIVGLNGAGKSTLLKMISGVIKPTTGNIEISGNIVPLLELGSGFDPEYTGRENIYLKGSMLGYSKQYLDDKMEEIIDFSELGEFIEVPLKNYSTGMSARLAFSIATTVRPEIMILDEVLSVGDAKFREKSEDRMKSMLDENVTVLYVSHGIRSVRQICDKAIWLEHGKMVMEGNVDDVCDKYEAWISKNESVIITQSEPAREQDNVPTDQLISLTFNENIKEGKPFWIELLTKSGEQVEITKIIKDDMLMIKPEKKLEYGTEYSLFLHSGCITDLNDNPMSNYIMAFTTVNE
jgi:ABC-2 type transport system ATP-binding protein/lipopolysaccharide transport system ATP-binding protein